MNDIIHFLNQTGDASLNLFWLPIIIWTIVSLVVITGLSMFKRKISALYHYHVRLALLWGLAGGLGYGVLLYLMPLQSFSEASPVHIFVIQNPISVSAAAGETIATLSFAGWLGLISMLCLVLITYGLITFWIDFRALKMLSSRINKQPFTELIEISNQNKHLIKHLDPSLQIAISEEIAIPCTFGWRQKVILMPAHFLEDAQKLNMALRHELMHIQNKDFLLNQSARIIRALFFFHPLVHRLVAVLGEYREICCDQHVLQNNGVSPKSYARLLLELSPKPLFKTRTAVSMAVRPSTLKKRIRNMKNSAPKIPSLKWSLSLMLIFTLAITGFMACSDMEDNGITQTEVEQTQANVIKTPKGNAPLYKVNGESWSKNDISRLKPIYIKSVDVLKGKSATKKYGKAGKNGVVNIKLSVDKETALGDLRTEKEMQALAEKLNGNNDNDKSNNRKIYMAAQKTPEMVGGRQTLINHLKYPKECQQAGIEGRVTLQFIVTKQGDVEDPQVIQGIGGGCDEAALRAIKQVEFKPARQNGKAVNMRYSWPVTFKLSEK